MAQHIYSFNSNNSHNSNINSIIGGDVYTEYDGYTVHQSTSGPGYYNHGYGTPLGPGFRTHVQIPSVFTAATSNAPTRISVNAGSDSLSSNMGPSIVTYNNGQTSIITVEESEHGPTASDNTDKPAVDETRKKSKESKLSAKGKGPESEKQPQAPAVSLPQSQKTYNVVPEPQQPDLSGPSPHKYRETDNIGSIFDNEVSSPYTPQRRNSDEISESRREEINEIVRDAMRRAAEATAIAQTRFDDAHRLRREILARVQASLPR
ncbi:hypothetical protein HYPSUDRAFT_208445 [Hypholoma sublateritium FD-334 SS-4]|uniref:Uncharacterized protein n=1 Tax=Hypholoma sublateritium (strain FD-334 SS-4) TaxID=945553 RepID=A0A0D2P2J7_HYPSF|nr:hypothetical protein HYPSUDRAFT_208445 [Hypholoma sublateritium FD-334 SS-4]